MEAHLLPRMGFARNEQLKGTVITEDIEKKMISSGKTAAQRRFTPEFINRLDKIVVFKSLGEPELRRILDIEIHRFQQHILDNSKIPFIFRVTYPAKDQLMKEGSDIRYGARHLRRAIQRLVMHPLSCLLASRQISQGDQVCVDYWIAENRFIFTKEASGIPEHHVTKPLGGLSAAA